MFHSELHNLIALAGLLLGKVILLVLIIYYCCKKPVGAQTTLNNNQRSAESQTDNLELVKADVPPSYNKVVLADDPPEYMESKMQEELNPEMNKDWAVDLQKGQQSLRNFFFVY